MRSGPLRAAVIVAGCLALPVSSAAQEAAPEAGRALSLSPIGYAQLDFRLFPGWSEQPGTGDLNRDRIELRRFRVGFDGRWRRLSWEFSAEPLEGDAFLKDAYIDIRVLRSLRVRTGHVKVPSSREYLVSARQLDFLERASLASSLAAGRDAGAMVIGIIGTKIDYRGGLFAGDGSTRESRAGFTSALRVVGKLSNDVEIGSSATVGRVAAAAPGEQNGLDGRTSSGYRFFDELYVRGRRVRMGVDLAWTPGLWRLAAEALRVRDERRQQGIDGQDLPAVVGTGWSTSVVRRFGPKTDRRNRQWQIGARYDYLGFDDEGPETGSDSTRSRASDVRARASHTLVGGVSWKLTRWMRLLGNVGIDRYSELRSAPDENQRYYLTGGARLQLEVP